MERLDRRLGLSSSLPMVVLLLLAFLAPMLVVALFSIMPQKVFSLAHMPDFSAYSVFFSQGYYKSLLWSLGMALASTAILLVICWPLAYGMAKVFGRFTLVLTIAVVMSLFVSENIRLFGWVLTLMKGGLIEGHIRAWTGTASKVRSMACRSSSSVSSMSTCRSCSFRWRRASRWCLTTRVRPQPIWAPAAGRC